MKDVFATSGKGVGGVLASYALFAWADFTATFNSALSIVGGVFSAIILVLTLVNAILDFRHKRRRERKEKLAEELEDLDDVDTAP